MTRKDAIMFVRGLFKLPPDAPQAVVNTPEEVHELFESTASLAAGQPVQFLWISQSAGSPEDRAYLFWVLREQGALKDGCGVFLECQQDGAHPFWNDFKCYDCVRLPGAVIFRYSDMTDPSVVPSMRGMYMR